MEENLEEIFNDKSAWVSFYTDDEKTNEAFVYTRCPCGRYLKHGEILYNPYSEEVKFEGWICRKCGEVEPYLSRG
jgi:hypothetical protein